MKKIIGSVAAALALVLCTVCLSACAGSIEGTYKFVSLTFSAGGINMSVEAGKEIPDEMKQAIGIDSIDENFVKLALGKDGKFTIESAQSPSTTGTYTLSDDKKTVTLAMEGESETLDFKVDGNKLIMEQTISGASVRLTLQK